MSLLTDMHVLRLFKDSNIDAYTRKSARTCWAP